LGVATSRIVDRVASSLGLKQEATPEFVHANNVCNAGVLFMVPALLSQGLLKASSILLPLRKGYYGLMSILLVLAFMFLSRIKCPEQLKQCKVGELGKIIGLDRVPEVRCLREKISQIVDQKKTDDLSQALLHEWMNKEEDVFFFFIDGHVRVYHGSLARLPKRFVSREKLCLPGTTEFWVNNELGMPFMVVTGELNDKLKEIMLNEIVPTLLRETAGRISEKQLEADPDRARFALVFDREAYDLGFFKQLWDTHRIAVLTYRKSVKDLWPASDFAQVTTTVIGKNVIMDLCEKAWEHDTCSMREIRKLSENGHQTSIITTVRQASGALLAGKMFSRWSQENFFRYMVLDYDLDKAVQYGVEEVNPEAVVVNPSYRNLAYRIKKKREKLARVKAKLYAKIEGNLVTDIDSVKHELEQQSKLQDAIAENETDIKQLCTELEQTPKKVLIQDMPPDCRYNKLKSESKLFMNTIRMIAYRSECAVANVLVPHYARSEEEIRMLVKEIIKNDADLIPDNINKTLTVQLHSLSTPRANNAVHKLCSMLNETETTFPGTDLRLVYKTVQSYFTGDQEF
jgi:hypothetical protein